MKGYNNLEILNGLIDCSEYFSDIKRHKNIVCYGAGSKGAQTVEALKAYDITLLVFVDGDKEKWGKKCAGIPIISHNELKENTIIIVFLLHVYIIMQKRYTKF